MRTFIDGHGMKSIPMTGRRTGPHRRQPQPRDSTTSSPRKPAERVYRHIGYLTFQVPAAESIIDDDGCADGAQYVERLDLALRLTDENKHETQPGDAGPRTGRWAGRQRGGAHLLLRHEQLIEPMGAWSPGPTAKEHPVHMRLPYGIGPSAPSSPPPSEAKPRTSRHRLAGPDRDLRRGAAPR